MAGGRMWVSPRAETDARAVRMQLQGRGLSAESLLRRYLPGVRPAPAVHLLHPAMQRGTCSLGRRLVDNRFIHSYKSAHSSTHLGV